MGLIRRRGLKRSEDIESGRYKSKWEWKGPVKKNRVFDRKVITTHRRGGAGGGSGRERSTRGTNIVKKGREQGGTRKIVGRVMGGGVLAAFGALLARKRREKTRLDTVVSAQDGGTEKNLAVGTLTKLKNVGGGEPPEGKAGSFS